MTDMDVTPMHVAYEEAKKDAQDLKVAVTGSELVCSLVIKNLIAILSYLKLDTHN